MSLLTVAEERRAARADHGAAVPAPRPDQRPPAERPPLRLVEPRSRPGRVRVGLIGTLCLTGVFFGLFALAAMHSLVVQAQFSLDRLDQEVAERRAEIEERRVLVSQMESPESVVARAEEQGMVVPDERAVLVPDAALLPDGSTPVASEGDGPVEGGDVERAGGAAHAP